MYHDLQGDHKKAVAEYEHSRTIAVELGNRRGEAVASHNLGLCHRSLKQYDKAIELFEQSLAIHEELGDRWGQARTRVNLARCLSRHGQHGRAVTCLKQALTQAWAFFQEQGDAERQARTAKNLGEALRAQAQVEHQQTAPDATSCGCVSVASADTLQEAETLLRTALDLGEEGPANAAGVCYQE